MKTELKTWEVNFLSEQRRIVCFVKAQTMAQAYKEAFEDEVLALAILNTQNYGLSCAESNRSEFVLDIISKMNEN